MMPGGSYKICMVYELMFPGLDMYYQELDLAQPLTTAGEGLPDDLLLIDR